MFCRRGVCISVVQKVTDRLLYQSEAEQLVPERGLVVAESEVPFSVILKSKVKSF